MSEHIQVTLEDDEPRTVRRGDYVKAKTKALIEFGYAGLSEETVDAQLQAVMDGGTLSNGKLDIIGSFIEGDKPKAV